MITVKAQNPHTIIRPADFNRRVSLLANDIELRWNPIIERWQLYQIKTSPLVQLDGNPKVQGLIMWTVEKDNGDYREPQQQDYDRVVRTIANFKLLQQLGPEKYADRLDKRDMAREKHVNKDAEDKLKWGAHELANHMYKKQTVTSMNRANRRHLK